MDAVGPPKPKVLFEAEPFIPYMREADFDHRLKPVVEDCRSQVGFLPNAYKLYAWRPEIAEALWRLERDIMGDPSSTLDRFLKRKLAAVACAVNGCAYSAAHSCAVLKKPVVDGVESWGMSEQELQDVIIGDQVPASEVERVCFDYIRAASQDPPAVTDEIRAVRCTRACMSRSNPPCWAIRDMSISKFGGKHAAIGQGASRDPA